MKTVEIPTDNTMEMIWAIREKINDETKGMTDEEWTEYVHHGSESFHREVERIRAEKAVLSEK